MSRFEFIISLLVMLAIHLLYTRSKHYPHTIVGTIIYLLMVFTVTPAIAVPVMWVLVWSFWNIEPIQFPPSSDDRN